MAPLTKKLLSWLTKFLKIVLHVALVLMNVRLERFLPETFTKLTQVLARIAAPAQTAVRLKQSALNKVLRKQKKTCCLSGRFFLSPKKLILFFDFFLFFCKKSRTFARQKH